VVVVDGQVLIGFDPDWMRDRLPVCPLTTVGQVSTLARVLHQKHNNRAGHEEDA